MGGPGGRVGHSMVLAGNGSRVIIFGGRDNEIERQHIPRTYEVGWLIPAKSVILSTTAACAIRLSTTAKPVSQNNMSSESFKQLNPLVRGANSSGGMAVVRMALVCRGLALTL